MDAPAGGASGDGSRRSLVVLADDLTGAAECAAVFAGRVSTSVVLRAEAPWPATEVVAVDTDTRHCSPPDAAAVVAAAVRRARADGAVVVKKVDSTLRGNLGVEVRAALEALAHPGPGRPLAVVAPAYPALGRTTLDGRLHVDGVAGTAAPGGGDVVALLRAAGLHAEPVPLAVVRTPGALARRIRQAGDDVDALVLDAECDGDLDATAAEATGGRRPVLLVGSAGVVRALAQLSRTAARGGPQPRRPLPQPALFVLGSHSAPARAQRADLLRAGALPVLLDATTTAGSAAAEVREALRHGRSVVLSPDPDDPVDLARAAAVAERLASVAAAVLADVATLVATGGQTARAVLLRAGIETLEADGEHDVGVVALRAAGSDLHIITKAGAFGEATALRRVIWPAPTEGAPSS